jgi:YgiT-type zinc finger domain-containing protein
MKDNDFNVCPICSGQLEERTILAHPVKGTINDIPHHVCTNCGELFFDGDSFDIVHSYDCNEKAVA